MRGHVRVDVDHLRLEPQPELHSQVADSVYEGVQTVGPDVLGNGPIAKPGAIVTAVAEPAVVKDEALDPDSGGPFCELQQSVDVVVEVDRLPHIEGDRPVRVGVLIAGAEEAVESPSHLVQAASV